MLLIQIDEENHRVRLKLVFQQVLSPLGVRDQYEVPRVLLVQKMRAGNCTIQPLGALCA